LNITNIPSPKMLKLPDEGPLKMPKLVIVFFIYDTHPHRYKRKTQQFCKPRAVKKGPFMI